MIQNVDDLKPIRFWEFSLGMRCIYKYQDEILECTIERLDEEIGKSAVEIKTVDGEKFSVFRKNLFHPN